MSNVQKLLALMSEWISAAKLLPWRTPSPDKGCNEGSVRIYLITCLEKICKYFHVTWYSQTGKSAIAGVKSMQKRQKRRKMVKLNQSVYPNGLSPF